MRFFHGPLIQEGEWRWRAEVVWERNGKTHYIRLKVRWPFKLELRGET